MFLLRANDKEIVEHIKENPRKATAVMKFDAFGTCSCSHDIEKGFTQSNNSKDTSIPLLKRCVRYGLCPHILLLRHGYSKDNPLFYTEELFEQLYSNKELDTTERSTPNFSGLYWIHVAIITGKFDAVAELLPLLKSKALMKNVYTLDLKLNPLHLALLHDDVTLIKLLIKHFPEFLFDSIKLQERGPIFLPEFLVLQNKPLNLKIVLPKLACKNRNDILFKALTAAGDTNNHECFSYLLCEVPIKVPGHIYIEDFIKRVFQSSDFEIVKTLCEKVRIPPSTVKRLIRMVIEKDNFDLCNILMTNLLKSTEKDINEVTRDDEIFLFAILGRNPQIAALLIENKFRVIPNCDERNNNLLKWAKALKLPTIYEMLIAAGCGTPETDRCTYRTRCLIKELIISPISTQTMENLKILVEESGLDPNGDADDSKIPPVYSAIIERKFDIVKYLLMKCASLKINKTTETTFRHYLCRTRLKFYFYWRQFITILIDTNAQLLIHFNKAVVFDIININVVIFDILYRLSHTIPRSVQNSLKEYHATFVKTESETEDWKVVQLNRERHGIINELLYKPSSLQMACRNAFRRQFSTNVSAVISSLGDHVPRRVIDFLNFDDVVSDMDEHLNYK